MDPIERYIDLKHKYDSLDNKIYNDIIFSNPLKFPEYKSKLDALEEKINYLIKKYPDVAQYKKEKEAEEESEFQMELKEFIGENHLDNMSKDKVFQFVESFKDVDSNKYWMGVTAFMKLFDSSYQEFEQMEKLKSEKVKVKSKKFEALLNILDDKLYFYLFCAIVFLIGIILTLAKS